MKNFYANYRLSKYSYCLECGGELLDEYRYPHHKECYKKYLAGKLNSKCQNKYKKCNNIKKMNENGTYDYGLCEECYNLVMQLNYSASKGYSDIEALKKLIGK